MINQLGLTFDEDAFYNDLIAYLINTVTFVARDAKDIMRSLGTTSAIEGTWVSTHAVLEGAGYIMAYAGNDHWQAFLDNYGTGSQMDKSSPFLQEYIKSGYFNPERLGRDMAVLSREGNYTSPNYRTGSGDIELEGSGMKDSHGNALNLEEIINDSTGRPYFIPQPPKHWLERSLPIIKAFIVERILEALDHFPFDSDKYLKGGVR